MVIPFQLSQSLNLKYSKNRGFLQKKYMFQAI